MIHYSTRESILDINDVAAQVGVKASSIKYYWKHDRMPEADVLFNGTPGWRQSTIDAWRPKSAPVLYIGEDVTVGTAEIHDALAEYAESRPTPNWDAAEQIIEVAYGNPDEAAAADALADIESEFGLVDVEAFE